MESLARLHEQRAFRCRLSPDRALEPVEEAEAFLRDRGLLTRTPDCALPSLYEACHKNPYQPGSPGFATWPATKCPSLPRYEARGAGCLLASAESPALRVTGGPGDVRPVSDRAGPMAVL